MYRGFPSGASGKESACQCRKLRRHGFNLWVGKSLRAGRGNPIQYSCLDNSMERGDWRAIVHGVTESRTQLSMHTHTHIHTIVVFGNGTPSPLSPILSKVSHFNFGCSNMCMGIPGSSPGKESAMQETWI